MALNASGAISLAGSTTGQSIAIELGQSSTGQISLNDTAVRNLAGVASGAITMPTAFWGKSVGFNRWYNYATASTGSTSSQSGFDSIGNDVNYNFYAGGSFYTGTTATSANAVLRKYSALSIVQWTRRISQSWTRFWKSVTDSNGNTYSICIYESDKTVIVKYNTSGTIQWQTLFTNRIINSIACDTTGTYVYILCSHTSAGWVLIRLNSSTGAITWQRQITGDPNIITTYFGASVACSPDGLSVIVYCGSRGITDTGNFTYLLRYSSGGSLQWQHRTQLYIPGVIATSEYYTSFVDSSGNIYVTAPFVRTPSPPYIYYYVIYKFSSTATLLWTRFFEIVDNIGYPNAAVFSASDGNVYMSGGLFGCPWYARYSSTGTLNNQTRVNISGITGSSLDYFNGICNTDISGTVAFGGATGDSDGVPRYGIVVKMQGSGNSAITTPTAYVEAANTFSTITTSSLTDVAGSVTSSTGSLTDASYSVPFSTTVQLT